MKKVIIGAMLSAAFFILSGINTARAEGSLTMDKLKTEFENKIGDKEINFPQVEFANTSLPGLISREAKRIFNKDYLGNILKLKNGVKPASQPAGEENPAATDPD